MGPCRGAAVAWIGPRVSAWSADTQRVPAPGPPPDTYIDNAGARADPPRTVPWYTPQSGSTVRNQKRAKEVLGFPHAATGSCREAEAEVTAAGACDPQPPRDAAASAATAAHDAGTGAGAP